MKEETKKYPDNPERIHSSLNYRTPDKVYSNLEKIARSLNLAFFESTLLT